MLLTLTSVQFTFVVYRFKNVVLVVRPVHAIITHPDMWSCNVLDKCSIFLTRKTQMVKRADTQCLWRQTVCKKLRRIVVDRFYHYGNVISPFDVYR